jgi:hypothetical protein
MVLGSETSVSPMKLVLGSVSPMKLVLRAGVTLEKDAEVYLLAR